MVLNSKPEKGCMPPRKSRVCGTGARVHFPGRAPAPAEELAGVQQKAQHALPQDHPTSRKGSRSPRSTALLEVYKLAWCSTHRLSPPHQHFLL